MKEKRNAEIRAAEPQESGAAAEKILIGRPIVYDTPTEIIDDNGSYTEIIKRGALDNADISDSRLLINHDLSQIPLARTPKTLELIKDDKGLSMRATLPDTATGAAAYEAVKRGDLSGMSFCFTVAEGGSSYDPKTNTRTITAISKVYEVSIVSFPAYAETSVEARQQMQNSKRSERAKAAAILANEIIMKGKF